MEQQETTASDTEKAKRLARKTFGRILNESHWMRDPDGEDHCAKCWEEYLTIFDENIRQIVIGDSKRTAQMLTDAIDTLRTRDGWYASCQGSGHKRSCSDKASIIVSDDLLTFKINGADQE